MLDLLRVRGGASRAQIAEGTGLSRATISEITSDLRSAGLVVLAQPPTAGLRVGRTPEHLTLNPATGVIVGVEFSHTRVTVVACDITHRVLGSRMLDHGKEEPWERRSATATGFVRELVGPGSASSPLRAIGVGVPGAISGRAGVLAALEQRLTESYRVPIRTENNARLAGLAEFSWGAGQDMHDLIYMRLAEGVGGLLIIDDEPRLGNTGSAGEFGHVCLDPNGPVCRCSNRGCLESYVGMGAVLRRAGRASVEDLVDALDRSESRAHAVIADAGARIGLVLANACTVLDLSSIVLGGALSEAGEYLVRAVRQTIVRHVNARTAESLQIHVAQLGSLDGALGSVALVLRDRTIPVGPRPTSATASHEGARTA
ncbi:ROK family transcriptional regulator [Occultella glacieicola]|uniref:ROK family transcriptional regulator n=1 Tax=Occultella glacieicola TaxID=2518684 RepID=UPI001404E481|nr:ROK family transcriptional regulator [Occultella glacieicola]